LKTKEVKKRHNWLLKAAAKFARSSLQGVASELAPIWLRCELAAELTAELAVELAVEQVAVRAGKRAS